MRYYKFPKWLKRFYPDAIWDFSVSPDPKSKIIYLTFDDGPNPTTTAWLLDLLDEYDAKATFFCIGKNVADHPALYQQLLAKNHSVGNHSYSHLNGAFTNFNTYIADVKKAQDIIQSNLFRPPYGKIKPKQFRQLKALKLTTVFWTHISYDFDPALDSNTRISKTLQGVNNGSIVVFHDSDKAFPQLKKELPNLMDKWAAEGYKFLAIKNQ